MMAALKEPSSRPAPARFPTPAEGFIDGHQGGGGQGFAVCEKILRCQQRPFSVEDGQKVGHPELIPLTRQVLRLLTRLRRGPQQVTACLLAGEIDQGVFCVLEGEQDALFVERERRLGAGVGAPDARPDASQVEGRPKDAGTDRERVTAALAEVRQRGRLQRHTAEEGDAREQVGGLHPHARRGRRQVAFCDADVGATSQQVCRRAERHECR